MQGNNPYSFYKKTINHNKYYFTLSRSKNNKVFRKGLKIRIKKNVGMALIFTKKCTLFDLFFANSINMYNLNLYSTEVRYKLIPMIFDLEQVYRDRQIERY